MISGFMVKQLLIIFKVQSRDWGDVDGFRHSIIVGIAFWVEKISSKGTEDDRVSRSWRRAGAEVFDSTEITVLGSFFMLVAKAAKRRSPCCSMGMSVEYSAKKSERRLIVRLRMLDFLSLLNFLPNSCSSSPATSEARSGERSEPTSETTN